jgi:hypothetical protein
MTPDKPRWIYYKSGGISYKRRKIISLKGSEAEALIDRHDRGLIFTYGRKRVDIFDEVQVQIKDPDFRNQTRGPSYDPSEGYGNTSSWRKHEVD